MVQYLPDPNFIPILFFFFSLFGFFFSPVLSSSNFPLAVLSSFSYSFPIPFLLIVSLFFSSPFSCKKKKKKSLFGEALFLTTSHLVVKPCQYYQKKKYPYPLKKSWGEHWEYKPDITFQEYELSSSLWSCQESKSQVYLEINEKQEHPFYRFLRHLNG